MMASDGEIVTCCMCCVWCVLNPDAVADAAAGRPSAGFPLMWQWHDKRYLGAAHGLCGILTILVHLSSLVQALGCTEHLKGTIDALLRIRFASGNLPSFSCARASALCLPKQLWGKPTGTVTNPSEK